MPLPELIGRYRPVRRLGSGGFAVVWLAHDESLDAEVAVKVMADNWADRMDLRERFLREARMLRQAASPRIVQVFDIGELEDGRPYLVMEHADRGTLADRIKADGALPLAEALRVTAEVARGVSELHATGVVHRDLKPSNVLITSVRGGGERLLVADLGVAKSLAHGSGVTMSVGSAGYMAPEQMEPQIGVDVRADVYSLGAFAFYLMTAQRPPLVMVDKLPADLPPPVRETLLSALQGNREKRWPDAASLADRLEELAGHVADDVTVAAARPTFGGPTPTPSAPSAGHTPDNPTPGWSYAGGQESYPGPQDPYARPREEPSGSFQSPPSQPMAQPRAERSGYEAGSYPAQQASQGYGQASQGYDQYQQGYRQGYGQPSAQNGYQQGYQQGAYQPANYPGQQPQQEISQPHRPAASSRTSSGSSGSSPNGRGRWIASMVAVVAVAAATGVGAVMYWESQNSSDSVKAVSEDNVLELTVPKAFGTEVVKSGWDPSTIGLKAEPSSGMLIASSVSRWSDLEQDVDGVFVGLSSDADLPEKVEAIKHESCDQTDPVAYDGDAWEGSTQTWTSCSGGTRALQEIHLKAKGSDQYVYMQVRSTQEQSPDALIEGLELLKAAPAS